MGTMTSHVDNRLESLTLVQVTLHNVRPLQVVCVRSHIRYELSAVPPPPAIMHKTVILNLHEVPPDRHLTD